MRLLNRLFVEKMFVRPCYDRHVFHENEIARRVSTFREQRGTERERSEMKSAQNTGGAIFLRRAYKNSSRVTKRRTEPNGDRAEKRI